MNYPRVATSWSEAGWPAPFPLPDGAKSPPPTGFTGRGASIAGTEQVELWKRRHPQGNAGLRLPESVLGLDVDHYHSEKGDKHGLRTLREHEARYGALPATWCVTRLPGTGSGTRLYRWVPQECKAELVGGHVDVIHAGHRYVVLPGSVHPGGDRYVLLTPSGTVSSEVPRVELLPLLPTAWQQALRPERRVRTKRSTPSRSVPVLGDSAPDIRAVQVGRNAVLTGSGRRLRERAGVGLDLMARQLGTSTARARHLETGRLKSPRAGLLQKYGEFLQRVAAGVWVP